MLADVTCGMNRQVYVLLQAMALTEIDLPKSAWMTTAPYGNCREQGFVLTIRNPSGEYRHICFYQHRNADTLCCLVWDGPADISGVYRCDNIPTEIFRDKWTSTKYWPYMSIDDAIDWTREEIAKFVAVAEKEASRG